MNTQQQTETQQAPAPPRVVMELEKAMRQEFQHKMEQIPSMDTSQLDAMVRRLADFDEIRGLLPAQEPAEVYDHTPEFSLWEDGLLRSIIRRQEELGL